MDKLKVNGLKQAITFQMKIRALDQFGNEIACQGMEQTNLAYDPQDIAFNLQRASELLAHDFVHHLNKMEYEINGFNIGRQPRQANKPVEPIPRPDCTKVDPLCLLGDEGPVPSPTPVVE